MARLDRTRLKAMPPEARKEDSIRKIRCDCRGAGKFCRGFHRLLGEMAHMQGVAARFGPPRKRQPSRVILGPSAGNELVRVLRPANYRDYCPVPSRCHRPSSYFMQVCLHRQRGSAEAELPIQVRPGGSRYSTWRGKDIPENTRPEPEARRKAVDHLRVLRLLIGNS
jgi:hypothetical protein